MFEENVKRPVELLNKFKEYEYILNVDKKQLVNSLFGETKAPLSEIREKITHYDKAQDEIMNLCNDVVDFPLFRIQAENMKRDLGKQAYKIKERLMEATYKYCSKSVEDIYKTYEEMSKTIMTEP